MTLRWISRGFWLPIAIIGLSGCQYNPIKAFQPDRAPSEIVGGNDGSQFELPQLAVIDFDSDRLQPPQPDKPSPPKDLWERMRRGFALQVPDNPRIQRQLKWHRRHPDSLDRIGERARPYLFHIVQEVERRGMPMEFALVPAVESAFRPFARSPSNAAGIWQFVPATGRVYGLHQTWWYDGRRDIVASTAAALDYLLALSKRFNGDWELALASYNAGAATVNRAIRKNRSKGRPTDYWSLELPKETQTYIPKLLAIAQLVARPHAYNISLKPIPNRPYFATVELDAHINLVQAAELAGMRVEELNHLNPGFTRSATDPNGPHRLQIPEARVQQFRQNLALAPSGQPLHARRYRITEGDTLGEIAAHNGISVTLLKQANQLSTNNIRAGKYLLIPKGNQALGQSANAQTKNRQPPKRAGTSSSVPAPVFYLVQSGDSLWTIARSNRVDHKQLAGWNQMAVNDTLRPGQKLLLTPPGNQGKPGAAQRSSIYYRVREGDSLSVIAHHFKVRVADLKRWNKLPSSLVKPGQKLVLYVDPSNQQAI